MEPAKIDWKNVESRFVQDDIYERINAPKWFDFSAPEEFVDDEAWFCTPYCRHPKAAEDFLRPAASTSKMKHLRSISVSEIFTKGDSILRNAGMKRVPSKNVKKPSKHTPCRTPDRFQGDQENNNSNFLPTPSHETKYLKSPANSTKADHKHKLKSTLSASNLFAGRFNQITEVCNELKKLVIGAKARENSKMDKEKIQLQSVRKLSEGFSDECSGDFNENEKENEPLLEGKKENSKAVQKTNGGENHLAESLGVLNENEKGKKPLLEVKKENSKPMQKNKGKEKQMRKRINDDEIENIPVNLKEVGFGEESVLMQDQNYSPCPQYFSNSQMPPRPAKTATTLKPSRSVPKLLRKGGVFFNK